MSTCTASWAGGQCDREATAKELCSGHTQQKRREKPFAALKGAHGALPDAVVKVTFLARAADVHVAHEDAKARGVSEGDVLRDMLSVGASFAAPLER